MSEENIPEEPEVENSTDEGQPEQSNDTDIEALRDEIADLKDQQLRLAAEAQNVRRRAEADVEKARKFGAESLVKEMLPVADSFERGLKAAQEMEGFDAAMLEGLEATQKLFMEALAKQGVEEVNPKGETFDPDKHQAISMVPSPEPANSVIEVVQPGYTLNGRVIRAAMVVVSQGGPSVDTNA